VAAPSVFGTQSILALAAPSSSHVLRELLKTYCSEQAFSLPLYSGSHRCHRPTLCTIKDFIYLLTYLLT